MKEEQSMNTSLKSLGYFNCINLVMYLSLLVPLRTLKFAPETSEGMQSLCIISQYGTWYVLCFIVTCSTCAKFAYLEARIAALEDRHSQKDKSQ